MNMECFSIYLVFLINSSDFCRFPQIDFVCILLDLQLSISFWWSITIYGIVLLISNSTCSLFIYREAIDFNISTLCTATCYNCCYFQEVLFFNFGFSTQTIMSSKNNGHIISSSPNLYIFYSLYLSHCTCQDIKYDVERSGVRGHQGLVPHPSGKTLSFLPLCMIIAVGLCRYSCFLQLYSN